MKITAQTLVGIVSLYASHAVAAEFSGVWTDNCNETYPDLAYVIVRAHSDGPYQIGYPRVQMSAPTEIHDDPDFTIVSEDEVVYKGNRLYRCARFAVPEYEPINPTLISGYLIGDWAIIYRAINGRKTLISDGRVGLADLSFFDDGQLHLDLKGAGRESSYKLSGSMLTLNIENDQTFRVLLVNDEELHLASDSEPRGGVLIFHRKKN